MTMFPFALLGSILWISHIFYHIVVHSGSVGRALDWGSKVASSRLTAGKVNVLMRAIRNEYSSFCLVVILKIRIYYNIKIIHFDIRLVLPTPCFG